MAPFKNCHVFEDWPHSENSRSENGRIRGLVVLCEIRGLVVRRMVVRRLVVRRMVVRGMVVRIMVGVPDFLNGARWGAI
jgi:hypothetical protein